MDLISSYPAHDDNDSDIQSMISTDDGYDCFDDDLSDSGSDDDSLGDPEVIRREVTDSLIHHIKV